MRTSSKPKSTSSRPKRVDRDSGDPNVEISIDHTSAPRTKKSKFRPKKAHAAPEVSDRDTELAGSAALGTAVSTKVKKKKGPRTVEGAKTKIRRLRQGIPTEEELIAELPQVASQEQEHLDEYLHMFRKLKRLIRKAEKDCLESNNPRGYYAVCTLYSAQREVIADIRSVSDMSTQVKHLEEHVLQPMIRSLGQNLLDSFYQVRKLLIETTRPAETQFALSKYEELTKEQGKYLQSVYAEANDKITKFMLGGA